MAMTTHAVGFRPPDDNWDKMKAAWDACEAVGAPVPNAVSAFFDHEDPGNKPGQEVNIEDAVSEWADEFSNEGYDIDIRELPPSMRITTDSIPHDADEETTNRAVADATRKDQKDMSQTLTDARRALTLAERGLADARTVQADMYIEECALDKEYAKAHDNTCRARVVTQDRAKEVRQAQGEIRKIKNVLYGGAPQAVTKDDVLTAYGIVTEAVALAERANKTAVSLEAIAIAAFNAYLSNMDKANRAAAETYAVTFAASHDIGAANMAANILFKQVSGSDAGSVWGKANEDVVVARKHASNMRDEATKMLEKARAFRRRVYEQEVEANQMATDAITASVQGGDSGK